MKHAFQKILSFLTNTTSLETSPTGYLDTAPFSAPAKGVDDFGRPFFTLPLHVVHVNRRANGETSAFERIGQTTFFKRFTDVHSDVWMAAESHIAGNYAAVSPDSPLEDPDNGDLQDMLLRVIQGEEVEFLWSRGFKDGSFQKRIVRLATVEEVSSFHGHTDNAWKVVHQRRA